MLYCLVYTILYNTITYTILVSCQNYRRLQADPEEFRRRVRRSLLGDEGFDRILGSGKAGHGVGDDVRNCIGAWIRNYIGSWIRSYTGSWLKSY